jgi:hypothetical protein
MAHAGSDNWVTTHGLILCLGVLCNKDAIYRPIGEFVESQGTFLIQATASPVERLSDSALTALSAAIAVYGLFVNPTYVIDMVHYITSLISRGPVIASRAIDALRSVIERFGPCDASSPLSEMAQELRNAHSILLSSSVEPATIIFFYQMLEAYLCRLPPNATDIVREFVQVFHNFLQSPPPFDPSPTDFTLRQCSVQSLGVIFRQYHARLPDLAPDSAVLLFNVVHASNQQLVAEALEALVHVISSLEDGAEELFVSIWQVVQENLESDNPYLIQRTVFLISKLFCTLPHLVRPSFVRFIQFITRLLSNDRYISDFYVNLLDSLAAVVSAVSTDDGLELDICEFLLELYRQQALSAVNVRDENEIERANRRYEVIFKGYAAIIQAAKNSPEFLIQHRVELFEPASGKRSLADILGPRASDEALSAFLDNCNVLLGRQKIKAHLLLAESRADDALRTRAVALFRRLKHH